MKPVKVHNFNRFSEMELSTAFNDLAKKHMASIKNAVRLAIYVPDNESLDDYHQEALIYCWQAFQKYYRGPVVPCHSNGDPSSWREWFFNYGKFGALATLQRLHPKRMFKTRSFNQMPEWFEPFDKSDPYDFDTDGKLLKMDQVIQNLPEGFSSVLKTYINSGLSVRATCYLMNDRYHHGSVENVKWAVQVLKHKLILETDPVKAYRFEKLRFYGLTKYACDLYFSCIETPARMAQTMAAYNYMLAGIQASGLGDTSIEEFGYEQYLKLLSELKKDEYINPEKPAVFKRRLADLFDYFVDLDIVASNPFKGISTTVSKADGRLMIKGLQRGNIPTQKDPFKGRNYTFDNTRTIVAMTKTGEVVAKYNSVWEASKQGYHATNIKDAICGYVHFHRGLMWAYGEIRQADHSTNRSKKLKASRRISKSAPVICMDGDGRIVETYRSLKEVAAFGFDPYQVRSAIEGAIQTHAKFRWSFAKEQTPRVEAIYTHSKKISHA